MKAGPSPRSLPCFSSSVSVKMAVDHEIFSMACIPHCRPSPDDLPPAPPPPPPPPPPQPPLFRVLRPGDDLAHKANQMGSAGKCMTTIAVCFAAVLLFAICYNILRFFYIRQRNSRTARNAPIIFGTQQDLRVSIWNWDIDILGLQQSVIDSIAVFTYKKDELLIESTECCVCLNEFQEDERLRLLPKCSHAFHIPCIDAWLRSHKNCPLCRAPIVSDNFDAQSGFWWASSSGLSSREHTQVGNSQSGPAVTSSQLGEGAARNESGIEDGEFVVSIPVEEDEAAAAGNSNMSSSDSVLRRSVSLDSSSAPAIYTAKRQVKSDSQSGQLDSNRSRNEMRRVFSWASSKAK